MTTFQWTLLLVIVVSTGPAFGLGYLLGCEDREENGRRRWPRR